MLIVRITKDVCSDIPTKSTQFFLGHGEIVEAERNQHGAVSAKIVSGQLLGLKPGEFEVLMDTETAEQRNRMALAFIHGQCSSCKDCVKSKDCNAWVLEQILLGQSWLPCDHCGEVCRPNGFTEHGYLCDYCATEMLKEM